VDANPSQNRGKRKHAAKGESRRMTIVWIIIIVVAVIGIAWLVNRRRSA
jgi:hypothetical protein